MSQLKYECTSKILAIISCLHTDYVDFIKPSGLAGFQYFLYPFFPRAWSKHRQHWKFAGQYRYIRDDKRLSGSKEICKYPKDALRNLYATNLPVLDGNNHIPP
jgi:hypothetical protein